MNSSKRSAHLSAEPEAPGSIDTGILAFGSSASVNGELKRETHKETEEIKQMINKTRKAMDDEQKASRELCKGRLHCHAENDALLSESLQTLDSVKVGEEILRGLKATTHQDFDTATTTTEDHSQQDMSAQLSPPTTHSSKLTFAAVREQHNARLHHFKNKQNLSCRGTQARTALRDAMGERNDREETIAIFLAAIAALQTRHSSLKENRAKADQVLQQEIPRLRACTTHQEKLEQQLIEAKQQLDQANNKFNVLQTTNSDKEKELENLVAQARQQEVQLKQEFEAMEAELAQWNHENEMALQQIQAAESLIQQREQFKTQVEATRNERNKLYAEKNEIGSALTAAKAELDRQGRALVKQQELEAVILKEKETNDQIEATKYFPLQNEAAEVCKQIKAKEELAAEIKSNPEKAKIDEEIALKVELTDACKREIDEIKLENDALQVKLKERNKVRDEYKALLLSKEQLETDITSHRRKISEYDVILETNRLAKLARSEMDLKLRVCQQGAALLKATADKEQQLEVEL